MVRLALVAFRLCSVKLHRALYIIELHNKIFRGPTSVNAPPRMASNSITNLGVLLVLALELEMGDVVKLHLEIRLSPRLETYRHVSKTGQRNLVGKS